MIKKRILHVISIFFIILGFIILLNSFQTITGFSIYESADFKLSISLSVIFLALGLLIAAVAREKESHLEKSIEMSVYNAKSGRTEDENFMMTDPELYFEQSGAISLGRFKRELDLLNQGETGKDLVNMIRSEYEPPLKEMAESEDSEKSRIATAFLKVLDPVYNQQERETQEEDYSISQEEKEQIKNAFNQWNGKLTKQQREILKQHNLIYLSSNPSSKIFYAGTGHMITLSNTPSRPAGSYITKDIAELIKKGRKHYSAKISRKNEES